MWVDSRKKWWRVFRTPAEDQVVYESARFSVERMKR